PRPADRASGSCSSCAGWSVARRRTSGSGPRCRRPACSCPSTPTWRTWRARSASRAGARAPGAWRRRSRPGWLPSIPPIPSSTTLRSVTSGCRATAWTAGTPPCARRADCAACAATGKDIAVLELAMGLLVGALVAGIVAWFLARAQLSAAAAAERETLRTRLAAAETLGDELRKQLSQRELDVAELRAGAETQRVLRAEAETRADEA